MAAADRRQWQPPTGAAFGEPERDGAATGGKMVWCRRGSWPPRGGWEVGGKAVAPFSLAIGIVEEEVGGICYNVRVIRTLS